MRILVGLLLLLWSGEAVAQSQATQSVPAAVVEQAQVHVCKVTVPLGDGSSAIGSGTYLGDKLILTAEHVVRGGSNCDVAFANPKDTRTYLDLVRGRVVAVDAVWDQAVVELERLPTHNPPGSVLASDNPATGEQITFVGYPHGRNLEMNRGEVHGYANPWGASATDWLVVTAPVVSGYSGGAAFNDAGELCGNLWGSDRVSSTRAACTGRTKRFLLPWNARLEAWRLAVTSGRTSSTCCPVCGVCNGHAINCPHAGNRQPRIVGPGDPGWQHVPQQPIEQPNAPGGTPVPSQPTPVPTQPTMPAPIDVSGLESAIVKLESRVNELDAELSKPGELSESDVNRIVQGVLVSIEGNPAFKGDKGDPGTPGERGADGKSPAAQPIKLSDADYSRLAIEVRKRLAGSLRVRVEPVTQRPAKK